MTFFSSPLLSRISYADGDDDSEEAEDGMPGISTILLNALTTVASFRGFFMNCVWSQHDCRALADILSAPSAHDVAGDFAAITTSDAHANRDRSVRARIALRRRSARARNFGFRATHLATAPETASPLIACVRQIAASRRPEGSARRRNKWRRAGLSRASLARANGIRRTCHDTMSIGSRSPFGRARAKHNPIQIVHAKCDRIISSPSKYSLRR